MGDKDFVKPLLERHATVRFGKVRMKPGKPLTFATLAAPGDCRIKGQIETHVLEAAGNLLADGHLPGDSNFLLGPATRMVDHLPCDSRIS